MVTQVITLLYGTRVVCRFAVLRNCSDHFCGPPSTRMIHHPRESHQPSNASKSLPLVAKTFVEKTNRSSHMKQGEGKIDPWGKWKNIGRVEPPKKKMCKSKWIISLLNHMWMNILRNMCGTTKEYISSGQIGKHFPEVGSGITWDYPMWMDTDPGNSCHKMRTWVSSHIFVILLMFPSLSPISRSTSLSEPYGSRITPTKFSEIHLPVFAYKNQPSHPTTGFSWICSLTSKLAAR